MAESHTIGASVIGQWGSDYEVSVPPCRLKPVGLHCITKNHVATAEANSDVLQQNLYHHMQQASEERESVDDMFVPKSATCG